MWAALPVALWAGAACSNVIGLGPPLQYEPEGEGGAGGAGGISDGGSGGGISGAGGSGGNPHACAPDDATKWLRTVGDASEDRFGYLASDGENGVYVSGRFAGAMDIEEPPLVSDGSTDVVLARFDGDGNTLWATRHGSGGVDTFPHVAWHPSGVIVCGTSATPIDLGGGMHVPAGTEAYISLIDEDGAHLWTRWMTGFAHCEKAAVDPLTGDVLVVGFFEAGHTAVIDDVSLTSAGDNDIFILRMDATDGTVTDHRQLGSTVYDGAPLWSVRDDGFILIGGATNGMIDLGEGPVQNVDQDAWIALLEPNLSTRWGRVFPAAESQAFRVGGFTDDGDIIAAGALHGSLDVGDGVMTDSIGGFVARFRGNDGSTVRSRGLIGFAGINGMLVDGDRTLMSGWFHWTLNIEGTPVPAVGGQDPIALALDGNFDVEWSLLPGASDGHDSFDGVARAGDDDVIMSGFHRGSLSVPACDVKESAGDNDALLIRHTW